MSAGDADSYLIEAVQRGDERAWRDVIERYEGRLLSFARRMLAQPSEAEDIVQETFLGLLRSLPSYDQSRSLETYLFAILRNKLSDHFRRVQKGQRHSLDSLNPDETPRSRQTQETPSRWLADREVIDAQRAALVTCLRRWVEQCQDERRFEELIVVEMLLVLGLRNKEVASDLGMSETAVAGVKFRVLERWRQTARRETTAHEWQEGDLAQDSTIAHVWRDEGISCLKRSTIGRFLLGALDEQWSEYVEFHVNVAGCPRCQANLEDLRIADERDAGQRDALRERCFASSVGFLSKRPE